MLRCFGRMSAAPLLRCPFLFSRAILRNSPSPPTAKSQGKRVSASFTWSAFRSQASNRICRSILYTLSGDVPGDQAWSPFQPAGGDAFAKFAVPDSLPAWLSEDDIAAYVQAFRISGFRGPLNWYRNLDRNWALMAPFDGLKSTPPALFITGSRDVVSLFAPTSEARLRESVPNLKGMVGIEGAGHWVQQEAADQVNCALLDFIRSIS